MLLHSCYRLVLVIQDQEKEFLLEGLVKDHSRGVSSADGKRVGPKVSRCIYRVMMVRDGSLSFEDAADGAEHFACEEEDEEI